MTKLIKIGNGKNGTYKTRCDIKTEVLFAREVIGKLEDTIIFAEFVLTESSLLLRNKGNGKTIYCLGSLDLVEGEIVYPTISRDRADTIAFNILNDHCKKLARKLNK